MDCRARSSRRSVSSTTDKAILDHAEVYCPTSPHQRDVMKRHVGPCVVEEKPALILSDTRENMYADFVEKNPRIKLAYSTWKARLKAVAWNTKKAYRSTCLDRVDVNFKWHRETLQVVAVLLEAKLSQPGDDADHGEHADRPEQRPDGCTWLKIGKEPPVDAS